MNRDNFCLLCRRFLIQNKSEGFGIVVKYIVTLLGNCMI